MEAYCYTLTDIATNKLYVGWHKGDIDDGYVCSTRCDVLKEQLQKRPNDFIKSIIAHGTAEDMYALETSILISENAMHNPNYYNKSNNFGRKCSSPAGGTTWWNNGKEHKRAFTSPGEGWVEGRLGVKIGGATRFGPHSEKSKDLMRQKAKARTGTKSATFGMICINNGVINKKINKASIIPEGWSRGMLRVRVSNG